MKLSERLIPLARILNQIYTPPVRYSWTLRLLRLSLFVFDIGDDKDINLWLPLIETFKCLHMILYPLKSNFWWLLPRCCFIATGFNQTDGVIANNWIEWSVATRFFPRPWWVLSYSNFWSSTNVIINIPLINHFWFFTHFNADKLNLHASLLFD